MLHPSYSDLMKVVNSEVEPGEEPIIQSRYSIVIATAKACKTDHCRGGTHGRRAFQQASFDRC